jgi:hypothetical protein
VYGVYGVIWIVLEREFNGWNQQRVASESGARALSLGFSSIDVNWPARAVGASLIVKGVKSPYCDGVWEYSRGIVGLSDASLEFWNRRYTRLWEFYRQLFGAVTRRLVCHKPVRHRQPSGVASMY